jgi:hypothetical protein
MVEIEPVFDSNSMMHPGTNIVIYCQYISPRMHCDMSCCHFKFNFNSEQIFKVQVEINALH